MLSHLIALLGWATLVGLVLVVLYVLAEIALGFVAAASIMRWEIACMRAGGRRPRWRLFPAAFGRHWLNMIGTRKGRDTYYKTEGEWHWIGDWNVTQGNQVEGGR